MKKKLWILVIIALVGGTVYWAIDNTQYKSSISSTSTEQEATYADATGSEMNAEYIMSSTNKLRVRERLNRLKTSNLLTESACLKLDDMVAKDYWAHDAPDGTEPWTFFNKVGYRYRSAGENLAYGQKTVEGLMEDWMNSPTHRDNLLASKWDEQGVCTKFVHFQGKDVWLTVHHFGVRN